MSPSLIPSESDVDQAAKNQTPQRGNLLHLAALSIVLAIAATVFFWRLGECRLWDRDEPRNAGCAVEMLERGDYVVPMFNDELRFQKPALTYWLMIAAYKLFGVSEFSARFFSALLGVGTTALTFLMARRMYDTRVGVIAGIAICSNVMMTVASRAATPDAPLIFFSTLAIFAFVMSAFPGGDEDEFPQPVADFRCLPLRWLVLMGIAMGLAMLAKGPVGFVMPMAIIGMFLLVFRHTETAEERKTTDAIPRQPWWKHLWRPLRMLCLWFHPVHFLNTLLAMRPLLLLSIAVGIALPWYVAVGWATDGDFLRIFFLREHFGRATTAFESHQGGVLFYPFTILLGFFPWSMFWLPAVLQTVRQSRQHDSAVVPDATIGENGSAKALLICWIIVQVTVFTIVRTKLPSYITPCYPALAIFVAACISRWSIDRLQNDAPNETTSSRFSRLRTSLATTAFWWNAAIWTTVLAGAGISIGVLIAQRQPAIETLGDFTPITVAGALLTVGAGLAAILSRRNHRTSAFAAFASGAVAFCVVIAAVGAPQVAATNNMHQILEPIARLPQSTAVGSVVGLESSWVFYSRRPIRELTWETPTGDSYDASPDTQRFRQAASTGEFWKHKPVLHIDDFLAQHSSVAIIVAKESLPLLRRRFPDSLHVVAEATWFMRNHELCLVTIDERP